MADSPYRKPSSPPKASEPPKEEPEPSPAKTEWFPDWGNPMKWLELIFGPWN